ncbi:hypothetical protein F4813DRAFT_401321 [Daldinia decipiens]|uniref:uncharacterized protein n=1 Tax=Daldinia decipiens TaxID=326647 RepID=UPI0020C32FE4|nr:uncharacterized protein F4813DRAFT_401321 [Daldinia decipiens]KAI1659719.1 hypothetical protein F4813DRAFT_401321 [Daldinia decipiens]
MASSQARQPPQAAASSHPRSEEWCRILIPVPNHDEFFTIEELNTRHTHDVLAHCQGLFETYQDTGDASWLEKRRLTLQQWLIRFDAMSVHLEQCKNAVQTALELSGPDEPADTYTSPGAPPRQAAIEKPATPPPSQSRATRRRLQQVGSTPIKQEKGGLLTPQSYLEQKIEATWHRYNWNLQFTLTYNGFDADPPDWYFARQEHGQWVGSGLRWEFDGVKVKKYLVLSTPRNLTIVHHALNFLRDYKEKLEDGRAVPSDNRQDEPLQLMVIEAGSNRQVFASGRILLRDIDIQGNEEIRSPMSGEIIDPQDTSSNDLIFPVEERTLRDIYNLHEDIAAEIDARDEAAEAARRDDGEDTPTPTPT